MKIIRTNKRFGKKIREKIGKSLNSRTDKIREKKGIPASSVVVHALLQ
jgi:hypothetical protein